MKRPPGITPPPPPVPPPTQKPEASPRRPKKKPAPIDADTVPVDRLPKRDAPRKKAPAAPAEADTVPIEPLPKAKPQATPEPAKAPGAGDPYSPDARRDLRRAIRSRRRYERAESRRFTQRSRRRRLAWLITGASLAGLVLVVLLAAYSPLLAVRTVAVEGTSRLDAAVVTASLDDQLGRPLALVDYGAIERDLAQYPLIASYSVEARPPDTLAIKVVERRPVAQVQTATGFDLLDAAGVTVQQSGERIAGFPVLDLTGTEIGGRGFVAAAAVLTSLPDDILSQLDRISGTTPDSVTFVFTGAGQSVVWGSPDDSELKARILARLIATQDPASPVQYDVSSPASPVVR